MSTTSKSPRMVALVAWAAARKALPAYAHRFSPKKFTQHQLFACLVLKTFFDTDYRGVIAYLNDMSDVREAIGLTSVPHFTTLQKAAYRLLLSMKAKRLLNATVKLNMGRRRRIELAAMDSTGLEAQHTSSYYVCRRSRVPNLWQTSTYKRFPKLGLVCDCKQHLILGVIMKRGPSPDVNQFQMTLTATVDHVRIQHLLADAGYESEMNHAYARDELGIRTTTPPRIGRPTKKPPTGRWRRWMKRLFTRLERLKQKKKKTIYGQRWQIETVFSMLKRRLGSAVHARTYWSQCRQMILMAITHNVMVLRIREVFYRACQEPFSGSTGDAPAQRHGVHPAVIVPQVL